jgi:Na+-driven multidrug efflux pump
MLGLGALPRLGLAGAGLAQVIAFAAGGIAVLLFLRSGRGGLKLKVVGVPLRWALFRDILSVGAIACLSSLQAALSVSVITGLVAVYGTAALAGYGIGARLEFMQVPLIFAIGATLVAMVGTNVGAGKWERARRIAWTGAFLAAGLTGAIGILAALLPSAWIGLFSSEPEVHAAGTPYLRIVGPFYAFLGFGFALYFASQGMARVLGTVLAGTARLAVIALGGWLIVRFTDAGITGLFVVIAAAMTVFGLGAALAVARIGVSHRSPPQKH